MTGYILVDALFIIDVYCFCLRILVANPSVWLEDYHLTCRTGGADDDLFII
jgi:hypothetical protein